MEHRGLIVFATGIAHVSRGSATALTWRDGFFDAVVTDPPYYDNVPYADIADFFTCGSSERWGSIFRAFRDAADTQEN